MKRLEALEQKIMELSADELADFHSWFLEYDAASWDTQIESDVRSGKLDKPVRVANGQYDSGECSEI